MSKPSFFSRPTILAASVALAVLATAQPAAAALGVAALAPGSIFISEVMPDPAKVSDTRGEWFEVYNTQSTAVNLAGLVVSSEGGANGEHFTVAFDSIVQPHGFMVFGRTADQSINGGYAPGVTWGNALALGNASDYLRLEKGDGTMLSQISWTGASAGVSLEVHSGVLPTLVPADFQSTPAGHVYGLGDRGTPGLANTVDFGVSGLAPVPEPGTYALLAAGLAALTLRQMRRRVLA